MNTKLVLFLLILFALSPVGVAQDPRSVTQLDPGALPVVEEKLPDVRLRSIVRPSTISKMYIPAYGESPPVKKHYRFKVIFEFDEMKPDHMVFIISKQQWETLYVGQRVNISYGIRGYPSGKYVPLQKLDDR